MWFIFVGTGVNGAGGYSSKIYKIMGSKGFSALLSATWGISGIFSLLLVTWYSERTKRRHMIIFGGIVNSICLMFVVFSIHMQSLVLTCISLNLFHMGFSCFFGAVTWIYITEVTPKQYLYIPFFSKWLFVLILNLVYPYMIDTYGSMRVFGFHAIFALSFL